MTMRDDDLTPTDDLWMEELEEDENGTMLPNPDWLHLTSVGIDIGSSTSHLTFSELVLHRRGSAFSSRFEVVERNALFRSPILLTPYSNPETIDTNALERFFAQCYTDAGLDPAQVNTGAVICTGEAVRKKNAEAIVRLFSSTGGKFVCATAGPRLEGVLAAHGSGSVAYSLEHPGQTVMNVDMGGGTSKITIVRDGAILETGAINVGARLIAWDDQGKVTRIEDAGRKIAASAGVNVAMGQILSAEQRDAVAKAEAALLTEYIARNGLSPLASDIIVTEPLTNRDSIDAVLFSGGVSEYVYGNDDRDYGDLGPLLARETRQQIESLGYPVETSAELIRATVIGASQYTVQLSSSTIYVSDPAILPVLDRQVIAPVLDGVTPTAESIATAIHDAIRRADLHDIEHDKSIAVYLQWRESPTYASLRLLAEGIANGLHGRNDDPWVLVFDTDIAAVVGAMLQEEFAVSAGVVATDEISVKDLDFIDIGEEVKNRKAVPVVVKSLVFG